MSKTQSRVGKGERERKKERGRKTHALRWGLLTGASAMENMVESRIVSPGHRRPSKCSHPMQLRPFLFLLTILILGTFKTLFH